MNRSFASLILSANSALVVHGDLEAIPCHFGENYVAHLTGEDMTGGHGLIRRVTETYHRAFANLEVEVEILVEGTDRVAWQRVVRGLHRKAFRGFPASGRRIMWRDMVTSRFQDGLIVEEWFVSDLAERLLLARKK